MAILRSSDKLKEKQGVRFPAEILAKESIDSNRNSAFGQTYSRVAATTHVA
jgi:hypothetical protein